jgi:hypothetical protein
MGFVVVIALLSLSSWILITTFRRLYSKPVGIVWWLVFCGLAVSGVVIGYYMAFDFEYKVSAHMQFVSFPIPVCFFHFENGQWVDFPTPDFFAYPAAFTNVVTVTAFAVLPVLVASILFRRGKEGVPDQ